MPQAAIGLLWISPWIVGVLVFLIVPVAMSFYYGLTEYALIESPVFVGLDNYREIMGDALFWTSLKNTLVYAFFSVLLGTIVSITIAVLLEQRLRGSGLVRAIVFVPTLVPVVAMSLGWLWLYNGEHGLINALLARVGVNGPDWLGNKAWAMPSLIIMSAWVVGSAVVIYTAALRAVPRSMYDSAAVDGVGPVARFRHVTLPMISPAVLFNVIMSLIWSLQVFAVPFIMTRGGPDNATSVFSFYVYRNAFEYGRMGYASSLAWIQLVIALVLTLATIAASRKLVYYRAA
jgi:multiple sugar transport system permease protein